MKIIKHGEIKPRQFVCKICGCEFIANISEYDIALLGGYSAKCPDCQKRSHYEPSEAPLCIEANQTNPALNITTPPIPYV